MRLPLPDPRDAVMLVGQVRQLAEDVAGVLPRALTLLGQAEALIVRVDALIDRIDATNTRADEQIDRIDRTITSSDKLVLRAAGLVGSIEPTVARAQHLLDSFAPSLELLQPTLDRLAKSTSPEEVEALVRLIDHLPELVDRMIADILPIVENMQSVAPDIHDMLDTMHELNEMIAKIPGMGRIRQRVEDKQAAEGDRN
jgi:ABC-type transporter Mla subunit MlaD